MFEYWAGLDWKFCPVKPIDAGFWKAGELFFVIKEGTCSEVGNVVLSGVKNRGGSIDENIFLFLYYCCFTGVKKFFLFWETSILLWIYYYEKKFVLLG